MTLSGPFVEDIPDQLAVNNGFVNLSQADLV